MWPALGGASAFAASSPVSWLSLVAFTVVGLVFLVVYARGWNQLRQDDPAGAGPYRSEGCRRLQRLAGGLAWGLVVAHLALQWFMTVAAGPVALSQYELLRRFLSHPLVLVFYVVGLASFGLFLSQGIAASVRAWGMARGPKTSQLLEVGATLASAMVLLLAINVLSHFVTGRAYWEGTADRPGGEQADVGGGP
jgi:hypothetical protein